jgi:hypothetical protein
MSESNNSYRLSSSSITTVSRQSDNDQRRDSITEDEQWPAPPIEETQSKQSIIQDNWRIEKNVNIQNKISHSNEVFLFQICLKDQRSNKTSCILKATMTKEQILVSDSSSLNSTIIPGKHISMKVVFKF